MNPAPLHFRFVGADENNPEKVQVFVSNNLTHVVDNISAGDIARLYADVYGVPVTMDRVDALPEQQLSVLTADHLQEGAILFDAKGYKGDVHLNHAQFSLRRALDAKILEAAQKVGVQPDMIKDAVRIADHPDLPGSYRVFAVQRMINPAYAQFLAVFMFVPNSPGFECIMSDINVQQGEFGKQDIDVSQLVLG